MVTQCVPALMGWSRHSHGNLKLRVHQCTALAWGARGPEFKSRQPDQIPQRLTDSGPVRRSALESNWSPNRGLRALIFAHLRRARFSLAKSSGLSPPIKTRQTRHLAPNLLMLIGRARCRVAPKTRQATRQISAKNPTNWARAPKTLLASHNPHNTQNARTGGSWHRRRSMIVICLLTTEIGNWYSGSDAEESSRG